MGLAIRSTLRMFARHPAWAGAVCLILALALGTVLAMFMIVNAVLFRALPFPQAERLFWIHDYYRLAESRPLGVADPEILDDSNGLRSIAELAAYDTGRATVTIDVPKASTALWVSRTFFDVVGVQPARGRGFAGG
jgi:putative ABC transport system permease protein